ncbi:MAG TPA: ABC transporter ATP-binding protein, partial [Chloroflexota bacterium]|nr:ABC transporter ATP-binding protein [Chloroflexota bacterium]
MNGSAGNGTSEDRALVEVRGLKKYFPIQRGLILQRHVGDVKAVDGIDLTIRKGETVGLVGESGCGKSTTGRTIIQLERATAGEVIFDGVALTGVRGES